MRVLSEFEAKRLLADYGVPVCREVLVNSAEAACLAAAEIGYPVVLKACAPGLAHKTEHGLVEIGIAGEVEVANIAKRLLKETSEVLVQEMIRGEREFMLGMKRDLQYGPCVSFGLGGVFAEAFGDVAIALAPVGENEAAALLDGIRGVGILGPYRGMPAVDRSTLVRAIVGLGQLALDHPDITEIDINPLIVNGANPVAVDALVVISPISPL
ncbi:MAG: acetate--CoA ligase family protein [Rhodospirillaceae bacterium]|jgi:acetate---CoA ligase (ADP-forming) subunit beta|nr:acetate--CoA ligase family protein [Rhodospirillaceae bacterium]